MNFKNYPSPPKMTDGYKIESVQKIATPISMALKLGLFVLLFKHVENKKFCT